MIRLADSQCPALGPAPVATYAAPHGRFALGALSAAALFATSTSATAQVHSLTNGSLAVEVRTDNGAINKVLFAGRDFFNPGTRVSDWGLQSGLDTNTFALNATAGGSGVPVSVSGDVSSVTVSGIFSPSGANVAVLRRISLVPGRDALSVVTQLTNNGALPFTVTCFDTFDPDQDVPGSNSTFNDVYTVSAVRMARGSSSSTSSASGTSTLSFVVATLETSAALAAGGPFQINSGSLLNSFMASPFDGNGTFADEGVHVGVQRTILPGESYVYTLGLGFGLSPVEAELGAASGLSGVYCTAGTTTHGCLPQIGGTGTPSASGATSFVVRVDNVEGFKQGLIFYGCDNTGFTPLPWGTSSSFMCVKSPVQRTPVQNTGGILNYCNGVLQLDWNGFCAANPGALGAPFGSGQHIYAQGWFRDPPSPKTTMLSDALEFVIQP